eukprot:scaffold772_cov339-Pavlova_lutheri.AAC.29
MQDVCSRKRLCSETRETLPPVKLLKITGTPRTLTPVCRHGYVKAQRGKRAHVEFRFQTSPANACNLHA